MTKRGRPKDGPQISRETILMTAFQILEESGAEALSMRGLAGRLGVTPMALYNHFADRSTLVREMSDAVYAETVSEFAQTAEAGIEDLLGLYYDAIIRYPQLTVLIFATPGDFSPEVRRLNQLLEEGLAKSGWSSAKIRLWLEILVDFTHGSAVATAVGGADDSKRLAFQKKRYIEQLSELLKTAGLS